MKIEFSKISDPTKWDTEGIETLEFVSEAEAKRARELMIKWLSQSRKEGIVIGLKKGVEICDILYKLINSEGEYKNGYANAIEHIVERLEKQAITEVENG